MEMMLALGLLPPLTLDDTPVRTCILTFRNEEYRGGVKTIGDKIGGAYDEV